MFVVGTAGHVDHGKSTLVKSLTGIDPDRLQEEKLREMTIDLGFAWLALPSGREVSIVDVPGHERFIKNMLAGVGGIDAALLVVAADEGVMPQTSEHLAILDLLGVPRGVVALTKLDLVDPDWLELVREEVSEALRGTVLERAPVVALSARTGEGLDALLSALDDVLAEGEAPSASGTPRLPIDRVFTVQGFGTVVTGTLTGGPVSLGQELVVLPTGARTRVRGLQTHGRRLERADPGRRLAVNLAGLAVEDLRRGFVLAPPGAIQPTRRFDARIRLLADAPQPLQQGRRLDLFSGAEETVATMSLLDRDALRPGESCYAQLRVREPLALLRGDRFILRQPSPSLTVGGGVVLDPHPKRHRRKVAATTALMETLERGTPEDLLLSELARIGPTDRSRLLRSGGSEPALDSLIGSGRVVPAVPGQPHTLLFTDAQWRDLVQRVRGMLSSYHSAHPLRPGMPREELKSRLRLDARAFAQAVEGLAARGEVADDGTRVRLAGFEVRFEGRTGEEARRVLDAVRAGGYSPPGAQELRADPELLAALVETGRLVRLNDSVYYDPEVYERMVASIVQAIRESGPITVARTRDLFNTSRKYALALLEHLDSVHVTSRRGDERVLR